jgi:Suppressor of fused protein (SUFU)
LGYPHQQGTWFYWGHTLGNSDDPLPFGVPTDFTGVIILAPQNFSEAATSVKTDDGRTINYLAIVPIHRGEMKFRFENGSEALANKLFDADVNELLRPHRPSIL